MEKIKKTIIYEYEGDTYRYNNSTSLGISKPGLMSVINDRKDKVLILDNQDNIVFKIRISSNTLSVESNINKSEEPTTRTFIND